MALALLQFAMLLAIEFPDAAGDGGGARASRVERALAGRRVADPAARLRLVLFALAVLIATGAAELAGWLAVAA